MLLTMPKIMPNDYISEHATDYARDHASIMIIDYSNSYASGYAIEYSNNYVVGHDNDYILTGSSPSNDDDINYRYQYKSKEWL